MIPSSLANHANFCDAYCGPLSDTTVSGMPRQGHSSFVYDRHILSTQSVGAMLWSMAQLRRGQLRMVVDVVGSC